MNTERMLNETEERSRVKRIYWAVVIIWAGVIMGANGLGVLPVIGHADSWTYVIIGAGLIGTLLNISYAASPETLNPTSWDWIWSGFWLAIGVSGFFNLRIFWPLAFLLIGVFALIAALKKA